MNAIGDREVAAGIDPLSRANARVGAVLRDKYRLDRVLGVGGTASVYAATHLRNAHRVAVKILHPEVAANAGLRARFLREGYAANSVEHPGTVRVLDDETAEDGSPFLVMELLDGETLDARWERSNHKLGAREVVALISDLLEVLSAAHAKGVVHRDIKPENLFLTREGQLKVLDFGVARLREASITQTGAGVLFGTPAFMAPEQALGRTRDVDALSDVWGVGATAFSLLTGQFVHPSETAEEMLVRTATQPVPPLLSVARDVPLGIAHVIDRALAFEKRDRWQTAQEMREALGRASEHAWAPADSDNWEEDGRTRVAPPPKSAARVHVRPVARPRPDAIAALPAPAVATIAGVASSRKTGLAPRDRRLIGAAAALVVVTCLVVAVMAGSNRSPTHAAGSASNPSGAPVEPAGPPTVATASMVATAASSPSIAAGVAMPPALAVEALPRAPSAILPRSAPTPTTPSAAHPTATAPSSTSTGAASTPVPPRFDPLAP